MSSASGGQGSCRYLPAIGHRIFGGNSNWRGPIWMPVNALLVRALLNYYALLRPELHRRMSDRFRAPRDPLRGGASRSPSGWPRIFTAAAGPRPVFGGGAEVQERPAWRDHLLFYEYFHGDNGAGIRRQPPDRLDRPDRVLAASTTFATLSAKEALDLWGPARPRRLAAASSGRAAAQDRGGRTSDLMWARGERGGADTACSLRSHWSLRSGSATGRRPDHAASRGDDTVGHRRQPRRTFAPPSRSGSVLTGGTIWYLRDADQDDCWSRGAAVARLEAKAHGVKTSPSTATTSTPIRSVIRWAGPPITRSRAATDWDPARRSSLGPRAPPSGSTSSQSPSIFAQRHDPDPGGRAR